MRLQVQQFLPNRLSRAKARRLSLLLLGLLTIPDRIAWADGTNQDRVTALFLYNLAKFVEWRGTKRRHYFNRCGRR